MSRNENNAALVAPAAKGGTEDRAASLISKLARASERLRDNPIPGMVNGDLYVAVKNEGQGTGWRYVCSGALVSDLDEARTLASPPPSAGAASGGSGDLGALSAAEKALVFNIRPDAILAVIERVASDNIYFIHDKQQLYGHHHSAMMEIFDLLGAFGQELRARAEQDLIRSGRLTEASAPTPDLGVQGEPVAWERKKRAADKATDIMEAISPRGPNSLSDERWNKGYELIEAALLEAPAAPRTGPNEEEIAELSALEAEANGGDWTVRQQYANRWLLETQPNGPEFLPLTLGTICTTVLEVGCMSEQTAANAKFIAAAVRYVRKHVLRPVAPAAPRTGSGVSVEEIAALIDPEASKGWHARFKYQREVVGQMTEKATEAASYYHPEYDAALRTARSILALIAQAPRDGGLASPKPM